MRRGSFGREMRGANLRAHGQHAVGLLWRSRLLLRLRPFDTSTEEGRSLERYRRIALTTASGFTARGVTTLIALVTVPLMLTHLGKERYGLWNTITTVVAWAALFDLGLANGLVNCLARAHGRDDQAEASRYFTTALAAMALLAAALGAVLVVGIPAVSWSDFLGARGVLDEGLVRASVGAALGAFVVSMPLGVVPQLYAGYQRAYVTNACSVAGALLGFGALLLALELDAGMPALILAFSLGAILASTLGLAYALGPGMPWLRLRLEDVSGDALRGLMSRSLPMFLFQLGALAVNETQSIILARRCGLATVAEYGIAFRLFLLVGSLIQLGTNSFLPPVREAYERGDHRWVQLAFRRLLVLRVVIASAGGAIMLLAGNALLRIWLRRSDVAFDVSVWGTLAALQVATAWVSAYSELLWILDRVWALVGLVALNGIVTVALTWELAPAHGVLGAFLAVSVITVTVNTWALPLLARRLLHPAPEPG